jgi:hypothetical protein
MLTDADNYLQPGHCDYLRKAVALPKPSDCTPKDRDNPKDNSEVQMPLI